MFSLQGPEGPTIIICRLYSRPHAYTLEGTRHQVVSEVVCRLRTYWLCFRRLLAHFTTGYQNQAANDHMVLLASILYLVVVAAGATL